MLDGSSSSNDVSGCLQLSSSDMTWDPTTRDVSFRNEIVELYEDLLRKRCLIDLRRCNI